MKIEQEIETKQTLTDITIKKLGYIWAIIICLGLVYCSRIMLIDFLNSISHDMHDTFADFTLTYIISGSHQILYILLLILLITGIMIFSSYFLIRNFKCEEKQGKILNVIITTFIVNVIMFKIIFMMTLVIFGLAVMFGAMGSSENDSKQH